MCRSRDGSYRRIDIEVVSPTYKGLKLTYRPGYFAKSGAEPTRRRPE